MTQSRTSILKHIARITGATICGLLLTVGLLLVLSGMPVALATTQDDARGFWMDTFTDTTGVSTLVSTTVDTTAGQVALSELPIYTQTDWSGGSGLATTIATTNRYQTGEGVDVTTDGLLRLGYTLRAGGQVADFNGDGYLDLVFSNYYSGTWGSGTYSTDSYVYYGSAQGYTTTNRLGLPTNGAGGNVVADLNNDGYLDVVFSELLDYSHIYWGSSDGYTTTSRSALSIAYDIGCSAADLDADGYLDLVFSVLYDGDYLANSYIYWGSASGFTDATRTALPTMGAMSNYIADLDQDGDLDIIFSNYRTNGEEYAPATYEIDSYIYWGTGSRSGYTTTNRLELPTVGAHGSSVADLNGDGYLDIVFSNRHSGDAITYTYQISSYIYWGTGSGITATAFISTARTELPTVGTYANSIADLDGDGYWDIVFSNHQSSPMTHTVDSYIYWGGSDGFTVTRRAELPTLGAAGAAIGDLDKDGYLDITFSNRRNGNEHNIDSYIYWGSSTGYTVTNRTSLPTHGALGNSAVGSPIICANTSFGNMYAQPITGTTSLTDSMQTPAIYPPTGVLTSSVFDGGSVHRWDRAVWNAAISAGTNITIEVATSTDGNTWSSWQVVGSGSISGTNEATLSLTPSRYLRYRVTLQSSSDHRSTPTLYDLAFWGDYASSGSVTSVAVTPTVLSAWDVVSWTVTISPGQAITMQVLASDGSLIPDGVLPNNSIGFSSPPSVDISALSVSSYPSLKLRAWFSSDSVTTTPGLDDWSVDWLTTLPELPSSFYGVVDIANYTETATTDVVVYKDANNNDVIDGGEPVVGTTTIWYDGDTSQWVYTIDVPGDQCNNGDALIFEISKDPDAVDDAATVDEDSTDNVIDVLDNDTDGVGIVNTAQTWQGGTNVENNLNSVTLHGLALAVTSGPGDGTATVDGDSIKYTPDADYCGGDSFDYTVTDNNGETDTATVDVTVTCVNDAPPVVSDIPDQTINEGQSFATFDLDDYVTDADNLDSEITWTAAGQISLTVTIDANHVVTISTPGGDWNGSETITFTATDPGPLSDSDDATFSVLTRHTIGLEPDWNLVSFNVHPVSTVVTDVLSSIDGNYDLVYAWDAPSQQWLKCDNIPLSPDTLLNLDEKMGFWIHMTTADTLDVVGSVPTTTDINLYSTGGGWNLVGYPSAVNRDLPGVLQDHGVDTDFSLVYAYHANDTTDPWKLWDRAAAGSFPQDLTYLSPGWGYWVEVISADHTWSVTY